MIINQDEKDKKVQEPASDKLLKTRSLLISGEINKEMADRFVKDLLILENESNEPVKVFIDSPGGDVDAGFAIYDMIRFVNCEVTLIGMGLIASAAALIYIAVPLERRLALPNSSYLIHQPLSEMRGTATEIEIHAKLLENTKEKLNRLISEATGKDFAQVCKDTERDHWLDAVQAKDYGLVGRIVTSRSEI